MNAETSLTAPRAKRPIWHDRAAWMRHADICAGLTAAALPWSTSLVAIFAVLFALALIPTFDIKAFGRMFRRPVAFLPLGLFALAVVGTLWASDIAWSARLRGVSPAAKLLVLPLLLYHFERSSRGVFVLAAFFVSCAVLMLLSWLEFLDPRFVLNPAKALGVPVKNYIAQSQEFALCAFAGAGVAILLLRDRRKLLGTAMMVLAAAFLTNMLFIVSSRTVLVCIPVLLVLLATFMLKQFGAKAVAALLAGFVAIAALAWIASPSLQTRATSGFEEYQSYEEHNAPTSAGKRLEFWRKSINFIERSPLWGHGTGATKTLFERDAVGKTGASAEIIDNPHNQTLNVAVQWGLLGVLVLYGMWLAHFLLFRKDTYTVAGWIGLVAVVENVVSSLFNSHIFDFTEGWAYVLAVAVAGGMILQRRNEVDSGPAVGRADIASMTQAGMT